MINKRIFSWFDNGKITEALVGQDPFFVANHTSRTGHDRRLVFRQLLKWADTPKKRDRASSDVMKAIQTLYESGDLFGLLSAVLAISLVSESSADSLQLPTNRIYEIAAESIRAHAREISDDADLRYFVVNMMETVPEIKNGVNGPNEETEPPVARSDVSDDLEGSAEE